MTPDFVIATYNLALVQNIMQTENYLVHVFLVVMRPTTSGNLKKSENEQCIVHILHGKGPFLVVIAQVSSVEKDVCKSQLI